MMDKVTRRKTGDQMLVRRLNTAIILDCLRLNAPLSRADISSRTGLNRSTVSSIVNELVQGGLVRETEFQKDRLGRPGLSLELSPDGACAIGVQMGVDFISVMLADFVAKPIWSKRIVADSNVEQSLFIKSMGDLIQEALKQARRKHSKPLGIGVGVPGLVDLQHGKIALAPNLQWHDVPLRDMLVKRFDVPVFVENDANASALGEYYFGIARQVNDFIFLTADVGVGAGIILGGKLFRGNRGYAGEVGHMSFDPNGELCGCGRRGCWESIVSPRSVIRKIQSTLCQNYTPSLIRDLVQNQIDKITFETILQAADANDRFALETLQDVGRWLGIGIANLVNAFNPELVVLGGALARASTIVTPIIESTVEQNALRQPHESLKIGISAYGSEGCVVGAAAIVLDEILRYPFP
ncbi:MAG: ROK family transcriptional regulator [Chloroflexi bacterium]|nr:ROK family transcriptional regulator [Chloroflexota bacterium]